MLHYRNLRHAYDMATSNSDGPIKISKRIEKELHQSKVVIRKLPPDLTEERLLEELSDVPSYSYFYFAAGDPHLGTLSYSRAYFAFTDEASILPFRDKYDGLYLESESGLKYRAVVEFAPYQGIPKRQKRKPDARIATIEQDSDYQSFLETADTKMKPPSMAELSAYIDTIGNTKVSEVQKTPLIDYLLSRSSRSGKRAKSSGDSKRRQGKESSKLAKDSPKDSGASSRSKDSRSKKESSKEGRDRADKKKDEMSKASLEERPRISEKRSGRDKRGHRYEENGEVKGDGERKVKEFRVKNRDRPDQAIYTPRGQGKHYEEVDGKESGRPREESRRSTKEGSSEHSKSGRGREYSAEDKPRRGYGSRENYSSKEKRYDGRRDDHRKSKDSYGYHDGSRSSYSSGYREK